MLYNWETLSWQVVSKWFQQPGHQFPYIQSENVGGKNSLYHVFHLFL